MGKWEEAYNVERISLCDRFVCVFVCVRVCARACVHACMHACYDLGLM